MRHGAIKADATATEVRGAAPAEAEQREPWSDGDTAPLIRPDPASGRLGRLVDSLRLGARSALARRFVSIVFLFSSAMACLLTIIQLTLEYRASQTDLQDSVMRAEESIARSLAESVWLLDDNLIRSHLEGLIQLPGVVLAEIRTLDSDRQLAGDPDAALDRTFRFDLIRDPEGQSTHLGTLTVGTSFGEIKQRISQLAATTLLNNFLQAFIVATFILTLHQFLFGRHLYELAIYASNYDPDAAPRPVRLDRKPARRGNVDELSMLEIALSDWARANYAHVCKLRSNSREQSEFNYAISHDLKSPTNTVIMLIDELRDIGGPEMDEDMREVIDDLDRTTNRMSKLIEDVLQYSRTIGEDFTTSRVDFAREVRNIVQDLSGDITAAGAEVHIGRLPSVDGNAMQLRLLFQNLISNALKFRDPDRPPRIDVGQSPSEDGWIAIHVRDNGIGIEPDHFDKIFGLFQRLHTKDSFEGSGIGLTTCQRVAANHQGRIDVTSEPGKGTTFTIVLPDSRGEDGFVI